MRLSIAAGILASTTPAFSRENNVIRNPQVQRSLVRNLVDASKSRRLVTHLANSEQQRGSRRRPLGNRGLLVNAVPVEYTEEPGACDPDVGLLACGFGQYCDKSQDSSLGGRCEPLPSKFQRSLQEIEETVAIQANYTIIEGPGVYCEPRSSYFGNIDCDCADWDLGTQTGSINCNLTAEECFDCEPDTCYQIKFNYFTDGSETSYQYCYKFSDPFEQTFCFGYKNDQTCLLSLDGEMCNTCTTTYRLNCNDGSCYSSPCSNFDCENVGMGTGNSCDGNAVPPVFYECYLDLNDLYPSCSICPSGNVEYPSQYVDVPGYGNFNCSYIDSLAVNNRLNPQLCTYAASLAQNACCEGSQEGVGTCNICGEEGHVITLSDAMVDFPSQTPMSCRQFEELAASGMFDNGQCEIVQGFVKERCGCMHPDEISSPTPSPIGDEEQPTEPFIPSIPGAINEQSGSNRFLSLSSFLLTVVGAVVAGLGEC